MNSFQSPPTCCCGSDGPSILRYRCPICGLPNASWPDLPALRRRVGHWLVIASVFGGSYLLVRCISALR